MLSLDLINDAGGDNVQHVATFEQKEKQELQA